MITRRHLLLPFVLLLLLVPILRTATGAIDSSTVGDPLQSAPVTQKDNHLVANTPTARAQAPYQGRCRTIRYRAAVALTGAIVHLLCPWGTAMLGWSVPIRTTPWRCATGRYRPDGPACLVPPLPDPSVSLCRGGRIPLYNYHVLGSCTDAGSGQGLDVAITVAQTTVVNTRRAARHGRRAICCPLRTIYTKARATASPTHP
ncbi:MAG: hypothetical protein M1574_05985 [Gammaproteobacteria bacterium]|nr:hypothetical protein [Gammaproteobacteria bacterium]